VLVDTNIMIDVMRRHASAVAWFQQLESAPRISVITVAELLGGARSQREESQIHSLTGQLAPIPIGLEIASLAGTYRKHFGSSHSVELPDALIAATAQHHGLKLATLNVKHFPMFKRLRAPY
jgi:predicted nucleic acid-binding protein